MRTRQRWHPAAIGGSRFHHLDSLKVDDLVRGGPDLDTLPFRILRIIAGWSAVAVRRPTGRR